MSFIRVIRRAFFCKAKKRIWENEKCVYFNLCKGNQDFRVFRAFRV